MTSEKTTVSQKTTEVSYNMIIASGKIEGEVKIDLCHCKLDGREMLHEWETKVMVPIFKEKSDVTSCESYKGVKLLEHATKIVEKVLEKQT